MVALVGAYILSWIVNASGEEDVPHTHNRNVVAFEDWAEFHGKTYGSAQELQSRRAVYESNLISWEALNKIPGGASYGSQNEPHADLTPEEFVQLKANCADGLAVSEEGVITDKPMDAPSASAWKRNLLSTIDHQLGKNKTQNLVFVDWRSKDGVSYVTPPKNQGAHGTCWSFAAAENLEGLNVRQGYPLVNISEQEFISCCHQCQGRSQDVTFEWLINTTGGQPALEEAYPYNGNSNVTCRAQDAPRAPVKLHSWRRINDDGVTGVPILLALSYHGPMSLGVDARCFFGYQGGIIRDCPKVHGNGVCNHAVSMVAAGRDVYYDDEAQDEMPIMVDYFTIKNSWGTKWGEHGYVRIEQGKDWWGPVNVIYTK